MRRNEIYHGAKLLKNRFTEFEKVYTEILLAKLMTNYHG